MSAESDLSVTIVLTSCIPFIVTKNQHDDLFNPLDSKGYYSTTSNNRKLVHWPLMDWLLYLVQRRGDWAGPECPNHCNSMAI